MTVSRGLSQLNVRAVDGGPKLKLATSVLVSVVAVVGWSIVAFSAADPLYGAPAIVASIATLAAALAMFFWQAPQGREPVRVVGLMVLVQTFLSAGISVVRDVDSGKVLSRPSPDAYTFATVSSVVFGFCFLAGLWVAAPPANQKLPEPLGASSGPTQTNVLVLAGVTAFVTLATSLGAGKALGIIPMILFSTSLMVPLFAAHHLLKNGSRLPLLTMLLMQVALAIYTSMLGLAVLTVRDMLLTYVAIGKRIPWAVVAVCTAAFLVLNPAKAVFREHITERGPITFEQSLTLWQESLEDTWSTQTIERKEAREGALQKTTERLDYNWLSAHVHSVVPSRIPYQYGRTYEDIPDLLIPRIINPDKATSQGHTRSRWLVELGAQTAGSIETVAISLPASAEAYWNFGWPGVFVVGLLLGLSVGALFRIRIADPIGRIAWIVFVASTCTFLLDMVVFLIPQLVIACISALLVTVYCRRAPRKRPRASNRLAGNRA